MRRGEQISSGLVSLSFYSTAIKIYEPFFSFSNKCILTRCFLAQNIARLQKAALSTSHQLLRCWVVLAKIFFLVLSDFFFIVLLQFEFDFFCHNLSFEFCHNLSFGVMSQIALLSCDNLSFWVLSQDEFKSLVLIWVFKFYENFSFWVLWQLNFLKVFSSHNMSCCILPRFEFWSCQDFSIWIL